MCTCSGRCGPPPPCPALTVVRKKRNPYFFSPTQRAARCSPRARRKTCRIRMVVQAEMTAGQSV